MSSEHQSMQEAHNAYTAHLWRCDKCAAAGQGYGERCADGSRLWDAYNKAAEWERAERKAAKRRIRILVPIEFCDHRDPAIDAEIERMNERSNAFGKRGLTAEEVDIAVECLLRRDRDFDDRHLCVECARLKRLSPQNAQNEDEKTVFWCGADRVRIPREWVIHQVQRCEHSLSSSHQVFEDFGMGGP